MPNAFGGNPIKITTAVANWAAMGLPNNLSLDIRRIYWETPGAAGDTIIFSDADGLVLFHGTAEVGSSASVPSGAGNGLVWYFQPREQVWTKNQGWYPSTITSGTVWLDFVYC